MMEVIKVKDGDCIVLETTQDSLTVHGKDGKIYFRVILKDYKANEALFKCPNKDGVKVACGIGYACDACPYNPDLEGD